MIKAIYYMNVAIKRVIAQEEQEIIHVFRGLQDLFVKLVMYGMDIHLLVIINAKNVVWELVIRLKLYLQYLQWYF